MLELFLLYHVDPITSNRPDYAVTAIGLLAAVLALLAGGCISAYYSFTHGDVEKHEKSSMVFTAWLFIGVIFLLIFLSMYCLRKADVLSFLDPWAVYLLILSIYLMLDALVLIEKWDATQLD